MLGRRRWLKRDIIFAFERSNDELTIEFYTWSLFNDYNNDLVLRKQLYYVYAEVNLKELSSLGEFTSSWRH